MAKVKQMGGDIYIRDDDKRNIKGSQFLTIKRLQEYQNLKFGMSLHYGMSTFDGKELSAKEPIETYDPKDLDVDQWIRVAKAAGMQYAILITKHVSGFALWPSKYGNYSVKNAKDTTDVVGEFVKACRKYNIKPCFYYCAWDNTNLFGMKVTKNWGQFMKGMTHTNVKYREFMTNQIEELLTNYGDIEMLRIDMPAVLPMDFKIELYKKVKSIQPNIIFEYNHSVQDGSQLDTTLFWPTDIMTLERTIPNHNGGHARKHFYNWKEALGKEYYIPGEFNDTIGRDWFHKDDDQPRDELEILGTTLASAGRGVNVVYNCPPDKNGKMPKKWIDSLKTLKLNLDKVGFFEHFNIKVEKGFKY